MTCYLSVMEVLLQLLFKKMRLPLPLAPKRYGLPPEGQASNLSSPSQLHVIEDTFLANKAERFRDFFLNPSQTHKFKAQSQIKQVKNIVALSGLVLTHW